MEPAPVFFAGKNKATMAGRPAFFYGTMGGLENTMPGAIRDEAGRVMIEAPAKVNMYLEVTGKRDDGYHLLRTLMVKTSLTDRLRLTRVKTGIEVRVTGADLPDGPDNLAYRAARAYCQAAGLPESVLIELDKRIPVAAGLGGGSSDAAAVLIGLMYLYDRPLENERLMNLGVDLGADVPFFLYDRPAAWATGIGEVLSPGPSLPKTWLLLVNPGWPRSTAEVFKNFKLELTRKRRNHIFCGLNESSFTIDRDLYNDLERAKMPGRPEVETIKKRLMEAGAAGALMTGSGPTVFGTFPTAARRDEALPRLAEDRTGWRLWPAFAPWTPDPPGIRGWENATGWK